MRILCDLDSIVADFMYGIWPKYVYQGGDPNIGTKDVKTWDWVGIPKAELIRPIFTNPGFFADLRPVPGAVAALRFLQRLGHEIVIVTAHCTDQSAAEKIGWVKQHLPFLPKENIVITKMKHIFRADAIIDDMPGNCQAFKKENPNGMALTISYEYNNDPVYDGRYNGYEDTELAWMYIVDHLLHRSARAAANPEKASPGDAQASQNVFALVVDDAGAVPTNPGTTN